MKDLFLVTAERHDGSTCTSSPMLDAFAVLAVQKLLALPYGERPRAIAIRAHDPAVEYADTGPILPMEAAMRWRQPTDDISLILR